MVNAKEFEILPYLINMVHYSSDKFHVASVEPSSTNTTFDCGEITFFLAVLGFLELIF
jgi:hypothetical protein